MATSRRFGVFAFGKQASVGTPLAQPQYAVPVISGAMRPTKDTDDLPRNGTTMARLGQYTQRARGAGSFTCLAHPDALGLLLYEATGTQAVTGSSPYKHTFTMSDDFPLPLTVWSSVGGQWWKFTDSYVSRLELAGTSGENVMVTVDLVSFTYTQQAAAPTYTLADASPRHKYIGSTTKLEADSATPATITNVESVTLEIDRAPEVRHGGSLTGTTISPERMVNFSAGLVYESTMQGWDFLNQAYMGQTAAGGNPDQGLPAGSFEITFGRHPVDAAQPLLVKSNGANWQYVLDRPDAEASPSLLEFDINGMVVSPSGGGTEITIELSNAVTTTY